MSITDALQKSSGYIIASKADVTIKAGAGNSNITVAANNVNIDTDCGDQNITVLATGDLTIDTGDCGKDTINAKVSGDATITTRESADTINVYANGNFAIAAGTTDPVCGNGDGTDPDDDKVTVVSNSTSGKNFISTGEGNDSIHVIANNTDIKKDKGELELGFIGNNININSEAKKDLIAGWGDNVTMNLRTDKSGNHNVYTFDQLWSDENDEVSSKFTSDFWQGNASSIVTSLTLADGQAINFESVMDNLITKVYAKEYKETTVEKEKIDSKDEVVTTESISGITLDAIAKKYNIPLAELQKYDFTQTLSDGTPKYAVLGRYNGKFYQLVERTEGNGKTKLLYSNGGNTNNQNSSTFKNDISSTGEATKTITTTTTTTDTYKVTTTDYYENALYRQFDGVKDWTINAGDGKMTGHITARDGEINLNYGEVCDNSQVRDIIVDSGYVLRSVESIDKDVKITQEQTKTVKVDTTTEKIASAIKLLQKTIASPLILDMNGDGKVSAKAGLGVDVNNDGKADGNATDGDKMLAMTDLNGNGKIDGAEVFGDKTVSPFSGKAINAANGFEALKAIAKEAKQYTGIDCMTGSKVDVKKLQQALAKVGVTLGFVSDNNVTELENLYGVSTIDVGNYKELDATFSEVEHLQQSVYTDENGVEYKVDDVWFEI